MIEVKQVHPESIYPIRHEILRPHQPFEACQYDADYDDETFHFGAFYQDKLISIGSFYCNRNAYFDEEDQYQLRAMATIKAYRSKKAGSALIHYAEDVLRERGIPLWWCNARQTAQEFYEKVGLAPYGPVFDLHPIGLHQVMYKKI